MTRIDNIYELGMNKAIVLPGIVLVVAQEATIAPLREISEPVEMCECSLDQMPSDDALSRSDVIVLEIDPAHEGSIKRLEKIAAARPGVPIIAGVESLDIRTTRALLKRGISDVLELPFSIEELLGAIADAEPPERSDTQNSAPLAPITTFIGCAGGVGTSTLATHVASAMVEQGTATAMLDLDIQAGDVSDYLGLTSRHSLQDLLEADKRLDIDLLRSVLTKREGMPEVLAAPQDILPIEDVQFERLLPVIDTMRRDTDHLIIDMPGTLTNWSLSTLFQSQQIVIVGGMSVQMLRKMRRQIDFLVGMGIDREVIKVVTNRVSSGLFKTIKTSEAEAALRNPVFAVIPEETNNLQQAQDQGELIWSLSSRSKFEKGIRALASDLIEATEGEQ